MSVDACPGAPSPNRAIDPPGPSHRCGGPPWCASSKWTRPEAVELASPARAPNSRPVGPARSLRRGRLTPRGSQASRRGGRSRPIVIGWPPRLSKGSRARWPRAIVGARVLPAPMRPGRSPRARHPPAVLRPACCADRPRWATTSCRSAATVNTASTAWEGEDTASRTSSKTTATIRPALAAISREST